MSQFHRLLAVQFSLLARQHESHQSVSSPGFKKKHECASIHATIRLIKNVPDVTVFNSSGYILSQHLCALKEFHFLCS